MTGCKNATRPTHNYLAEWRVGRTEEQRHQRAVRPDQQLRRIVAQLVCERDVQSRHDQQRHRDTDPRYRGLRPWHPLAPARRRRADRAAELREVRKHRRAPRRRRAVAGGVRRAVVIRVLVARLAVRGAGGRSFDIARHREVALLARAQLGHRLLAAVGDEHRDDGLQTRVEERDIRGRLERCGRRARAIGVPGAR